MRILHSRLAIAPLLLCPLLATVGCADSALSLPEGDSGDLALVRVTDIGIRRGPVDIAIQPNPRDIAFAHDLTSWPDLAPPADLLGVCNPEFLARPPSIDFGKVKQGVLTTLTVTITNVTNNSVTVRSIAAGGVNVNDFAVDDRGFSPKDLGPGASIGASVSFDGAAGKRTAVLVVASTCSLVVPITAEGI